MISYNEIRIKALRINVELNGFRIDLIDTKTF
jgi:hypothetical protein